MLDDVDGMIESYAGKDILEEANADLEKYLNPTIKFDWKNVLLLFLPHQIADLNALVEAVKRLSPDYVGVAHTELYKPFISALAKYQGFADIKNVGAAVHAMTKAALQEMNAENTDDVKWVQLSNIFGSRAVSKDKAEIIAEAIKKAVDSGLIDSKNKLDFLTILSERYLDDEK